MFWFELSQIYHKFRVPSWVVQLIRGLPAWFIAMHSLTIHHLLAPLIILAKDNYTAQRCTAERNTNSYLTTWTTTLGGESETSVEVWPQHYRRVHVHVYVCDCALLRSCTSDIRVYIQGRISKMFLNTALLNWCFFSSLNSRGKKHIVALSS